MQEFHRLLIASRCFVDEELLLICPRCRVEYRPGFDVCADCEVALVEESDLLANGGSGAAARGDLDLEPFHETRSSDELGAILESFEEEGVAYVVTAGTALSLLTGVDAGDELPEAWHARIVVPGAFLARAQAILTALRQQALVARGEAAARPPI